MSNDAPPGKLLSRATARYLGPIPKNATKLQRLRWTRAVGLKLVIPFLPVLVFAVIEIDQTWAYALFGIWALIWLGSLARLSLDIRGSR